MKTITSVIIINSLLSSACFAKPVRSYSLKQMFLGHDSSRIAIIPYKSNPSSPGPVAAELSAAELAVLDSLFSVFVADEEGKLATDKRRHQKIDLQARAYYRQYVASINSDGQKRVWINCFCGAPPSYWRKQI